MLLRQTEAQRKKQVREQTQRFGLGEDNRERERQRKKKAPVFISFASHTYIIEITLFYYYLFLGILYFILLSPNPIHQPNLVKLCFARLCSAAM